MFAESHDVAVRRIALNMNQIEEFQPPPNPAKLSDSRAGGYIRKFGKQSWELDALPPVELNELIVGAISDYIDFDVWRETLREEQQVESRLKQVYEEWKS
jgi:hypothetical protein